MDSLRIGVNALYLLPGGVGGTEIYLRNLLSAWRCEPGGHRFVVFTNRETGTALVEDSEHMLTLTQPVAARNRVARLAFEQNRLPRVVREQKLDVLFNPGFTAPFFVSCPNVTVFHDLQHKRHPEYFRWWDLPFWDFFLAGSARQSERLIAVSESTRRDLERFYRLRPERITVVPHGVEPEFFAVGERREPEPYLLCVSTSHPHKNLERLVTVFAKLRERMPRFRLVLAGMKGFHHDHVAELVGRLGLQEAVRMPGWMSRADLYRLYERAWAFVYPSTFEGFGMPVLEAMAAGIPLACSDIPPLREIADESAVLFDPHDEAAMLSALERVCDDTALRQQAALTGPEHARRYTWADAARMTLDALESAAQRSRSSS